MSELVPDLDTFGYDPADDDTLFGERRELFGARVAPVVRDIVAG